MSCGDEKGLDIVYTGHMLFPWGQAASRRVYGNAMSMVDGGRNVVVVSGSDEPNGINVLETHENGKCLSHIGLGTSPSGGGSPIQKAWRLLFASSSLTVRWLDAQPKLPSHVVLYGGYTPYLVRLLPWCRRNNVPLIADIVEWHDPEQLPGGKVGMTYLNYSLAMRWLYPKCDGIISISSYLSEFYKGKECPVVQIPPTLDILGPDRPVIKRTNSKMLKLVYAGDPGRKDLLKPVVEGMRMVDPSGANLELTIIGPTEDQVCVACSLERVPESGIVVLGRLPQREVSKFVQEADFSVILRTPARFSSAGFPTKLVESMANAVPVIANLTSDIGCFLLDGEDGIVCEDHSAASFAEALQRVVKLSSDEILNMKKAAYSNSIASFDYRNYAKPLAEFLCQIN